MRFKMTLEYEGTRYSGWQIQKNARTVQGDLAAALRKIFNTDDLELYGSGRTDAGVHALAQVAHLEVATMLAPEIIRMKVNDELPPDINILEVEKISPAFHARHDAEARSYLYQISRRRTAFGKRYVWWVKDRLDIRAMREAASLFQGMKDFRSFTDDDPDRIAFPLEAGPPHGGGDRGSGTGTARTRYDPGSLRGGERSPRAPDSAAIRPLSRKSLLSGRPPPRHTFTRHHNHT